LLAINQDFGITFARRNKGKVKIIDQLNLEIKTDRIQLSGKD
jgi:hypothetical protein